MAEEKQKRSRWFTCLVKGPLGCLAFAFGAFVVLMLFVPAVVGRLFERGLERDFGSYFAGSLEISDAWLGSTYNPQRIDGLILRDPAGEEILRGSLRAPAFLSAFAGERYGPIEVVLQGLKLVEHADGSTNLERALERIAGSVLSLGYSVSLPGECELVVRIDRLRWADARGREELLSDLVWHGTLTKDARFTRVVLQGGSDPGLVEPFSLGLVYERRRGESEAEARLELSAARVPLGLLRHVAGRAVPVGALEGPTLESLSWTRERGRAKLRVGDGALALECAGVQEEGLLRTEPGLPATLVLDPGTPAGEFLLARLVPLLVPQVLPGERRVTFEGEGLVLPLAGGWDGLAGRVRFTLPPGTFRLDPAVNASFGPTLALAPEALQLELEVAGGRVLLDGLALPLTTGRLEYAGQVELATGLAEVSFVREHDGQRTPLGRWRGPVDELVPSMPVPPQVPEVEERGVGER